MYGGLLKPSNWLETYTELSHNDRLMRFGSLNREAL